jgi:hypothetical protein
MNTITEIKGFFVRKGILEKAEDLQALLKVGFKRDFPDAYFHWKYINPPNRPAFVYNVLNETKEKCVSTYSAIEQEYLFKGKTKSVFLVMDATTDPAYQGKGLSSILSTEMCQDLANLKNTFVLGYPAPIPYKAYVTKLGWKHLADIKVMALPYSRLRPILKKVTSWFKKDLLELRLVERYGKNVDIYFEQKTNYNVPICKKYNAAILNWHTVDSGAYPNFKLYELYENKNLVGVLIYLERRKYEVEILKLDFCADSLYQTYLPTILDHISNREGARLIYMWETKNPPLRKSLEKMGFYINYDNPNQFGYHSFPVTIYTKQAQIEGIDIFDANNYELDIFTRDFV